MIIRKYPTVPVYVEDSAPGSGSLEMPDLVIRGDKCMDEQGSADDCEIKGEKESQEGKESHSRGYREWDGGLARLRIYICGSAESESMRRCNSIWRGRTTASS